MYVHTETRSQVSSLVIFHFQLFYYFMSVLPLHMYVRAWCLRLQRGPNPLEVSYREL